MIGYDPIEKDEGQWQRWQLALGREVLCGAAAKKVQYTDGEGKTKTKFTAAKPASDEGAQDCAFQDNCWCRD